MIKSLEITTRSSCPVNCSMCPQSALKTAYAGKERFLSFGNFKLILEKLPKDVRIDFSGFAEPLLNVEAGRMIAHAKREGFVVYLYTTLVGIDHGTMTYIFNNPPDLIRIHVPDLEHMKFDEEKWIENYDLFRHANLQHTLMAMGPMSEKIRGHLCALGVSVEMPDMLSRAGHLWKPRKITKFKGCSMNRWHQNVLMPDGSVYGCCMSYSLTPKLGSLRTQSYQEIYDAAEAWKASDHSNDICSECEWAVGI